MFLKTYRHQGRLLKVICLRPVLAGKAGRDLCCLDSQNRRCRALAYTFSRLQLR